MKTLYRARLETEHFQFEAFAERENQALAALKRGFSTHARQYRIADPDWWRLYEDDIVVECITLGVATRDHEELR
jgi:hypothetical protein